MVGDGRNIRVVRGGSMPPIEGDYAVLVYAADATPPPVVAWLVRDPHCRSIAAVGPLAEALHDAIDDVFLDANVEHRLVTTFHADLAEGFEYFALCPGADETLIVFTDNGPVDLVAGLLATLEEYGLARRSEIRCT